MKKGISNNLITVILACILAFSAGAQDVEGALRKIAGNPPEKLYIHYDKEYYVAGETIFFKAYLYNNNKPSGRSNNLFLQFTDGRGVIVTTKQFPVVGAVAKGNIDLPDSLPEGNYYLRALTPVMLNEEEEFIYKKNIFVFKPKSIPGHVKPIQQTVSVQFFPESGDLVDGILTTIAFKAADQHGIPVNISGVLRADDGMTIAPFKSYHDGIGKLTFKPKAGKNYIAEVETAAGKRTYPLPVVKASGINLKIEDEKGGKKFQLTRSEKDKLQFDRLTLVAQMNNQVVNNYDISFDDYPSVIGHLITDSLPSGIMQITIFNKDAIPIAERLCFVNNREYVGNASIIASQVSTEKRAANQIELSFTEAIQRSCSVAIIDGSAGSFNDNDNIWSRFLLTSDLKGYVYNPAWYFRNNTDSTKLALDNLMLTHGWSRFNWTRILSSPPPENKHVDIPLIYISGTVKDDKNKDLLGNGKLNIYLEAADSTSYNYETAVDANGKFTLDSLLFFGKAKLYYAFIDHKGKQKPALVTLDENPWNKIRQLVPAQFLSGVKGQNADIFGTAPDIEARYDYVRSRLDEVRELEKVTVESKTNKKPMDAVNEKYTSGVFRSPGKVNLDNINEPSNDKSMNAVDYIKNRIQQLELQNNQFVNRKNFSLMTGQKWLVGIFINEVPADIFQLRLLRTSDIALVKFYEAGFVGVGSGSPGGALAVYTKDRDKNEEKPDKLTFVEYEGYSVSKEFYNPDYANPETRKPLSDKRTTLYWSPDVFTDAETKSIKLNFFNNDFSKKFKVIVEGFDANGKLIHTEKILN